MATVKYTRYLAPLAFTKCDDLDEVVYKLDEYAAGDDRYLQVWTSRGSQVMAAKFGADAGYMIDTRGAVYRWMNTPANRELLPDHRAAITTDRPGSMLDDDVTIAIRVSKQVENGSWHRVMYIVETPTLLKPDRPVAVKMIDMRVPKEEGNNSQKI